MTIGSVSSGPSILVLGSLNVDRTLRVPRIPVPGETLTATATYITLGGKGANQAVAATRAGGQVSLVGCVGDDEAGNDYLAHLTREGIDRQAVRVDPVEPTGSASIQVDDAGENTIVVHPGANHTLTPEHHDEHTALFEQADVLLLQLECPLSTVARAIELARSAGTPVILNPSPWQPDAAALEADVWIVNESEDAQLPDKPDAIRIITRGAAPTIVRAPGQSEFTVSPPSVDPVDTVGAGDTFAGAFAVAWAEGRPLAEAVRFANIAGALATLQAGAQSAMPRRTEIESHPDFPSPESS